MRDEATAVFAADAVARLTGVPGVAAVTAGPGVTNTITALKNAQLAQSPLVLLGGAAPTALQGRGALQDIDQRPLVAPHVKLRATGEAGARSRARRRRSARRRAATGVPGPVFVECPVDLLYDEATRAQWYAERGRQGRVASRSACCAGTSRRHVEPDVRRRRRCRGRAGGRCRCPACGARCRASRVRRARRSPRAQRPLLLDRQPGAACAPTRATVARRGRTRSACRCTCPAWRAGLLGRDHPLADAPHAAPGAARIRLRAARRACRAISASTTAATPPRRDAHRRQSQPRATRA